MADEINKLYEELIERNKKFRLLNSCAAVLGWDERSYMPRDGAEHRANQIALISGMSHELATDTHIGELLSKLENSELMNDEVSDEATNIREIRRAYDKMVKLPKDLVEDISHTTTRAQGIWVEARAKSDFKHFQDILKKIIDLNFRVAECYGYETEPYDALLDDYEPAATIEFISRVFSDLRDDLVPLVEKIKASGKHPDMSLIETDYDVHRQELFGKAASAAIGYDYGAGRLDVTTHPFCTGIGPGDVRILTRYNPKHFGQAFFGILHESGHGIYEQGLPRDKYFGTPMGDAVSLGIHESQSLTWENLVGRGKPFWKHFFPRARQTWPEVLGNVNFDDFYFAINDVRPSFIRVDADEVTYCLHILLRFEIEQAIFRNEIKVEDIPAVWNEKFNSYFGITPSNDSEGCLQDVHWAMGVFGYFPTYALGTLYSAQFFAKAREEMPNLFDEFEKGDFSSLKNWLNKNIHCHGQRYTAGKLVEVVTGKPLSHKPFMEYLEKKYTPLYLR
jgi:carboxypeptidase Taq